MSYARIDWTRVCWEKRNSTLAREYGLSREAVRKARLRFGVKKIISNRAKADGQREVCLKLIRLDKLGVEEYLPVFAQDFWRDLIDKAKISI